MKLYEGFQFMGILIGILRKIIRFFFGFSMNEINHPFSGPIYGGTTVMDLKKRMVRPGAGHFGWGLLKEQRNRLPVVPICSHEASQSLVFGILIQN
jgi:hypothetical protein